MTRIATWKRDLWAALSVELSQEGLVSRPAEQAFYLPKPFGRACFHLAFIPHPDTDFDVTADVALRFDAVENLFNKSKSNATLLSKRQRSKTATLGCELGNLTEGRQRRWSVASDADIQPTAKSIANAYRTIAVPYFERLSDLEEVLKTLWGNEPSNWLHSPFHDARYSRAIALALVLGKRDQAEQMIEEAEALLLSKKDPSITFFHEFVESIRGS